MRSPQLVHRGLGKATGYGWSGFYRGRSAWPLARTQLLEDVLVRVFGFVPKVALRPPGHQFQSPRMRMVAGTSRIRIIVASTNTTTALSGIKMERKVISRIRYVAPITKAAARGALP